MQNFNFTTVSTIKNEYGGASRIGEVIEQYGYQKILVVADEGIVKAGHLQKVIQGLKDSNIDFVTYVDVGPDPKEHMVADAVNAAVDNKVDCIIGIGGGSVMDVAKVTAVLTAHDTTLAQIYGINQIKGPRLPLILIPTTAGTGSEATSSSVISDSTGKKNVVIDPTLYPDIALLDAELLSSMPKHIVSSTGVDAIVHAIEAFTSATKKNPISDMLACEALRYLLANIEGAYGKDSTTEDLSNMLIGSTLAGQAFANSSVAAVHAFAYALAEQFHLPHGLSNSLVLVHILKFNISVDAEIYSKLAKAIFPETMNQSNEAAAQYLLERLERILSNVNLDKGLKHYGIKEENLQALAEAASKIERLLNNNPCPIGYDDALLIFRNAF